MDTLFTFISCLKLHQVNSPVMVGNQFILDGFRGAPNDKKSNIMILFIRFEVLNKLHSTISSLFRIDFVIFTKRGENKKKKIIK